MLPELPSRRDPRPNCDTTSTLLAFLRMVGSKSFDSPFLPFEKDRHPPKERQVLWSRYPLCQLLLEILFFFFWKLLLCATYFARRLGGHFQALALIQAVAWYCQHCASWRHRLNSTAHPEESCCFRK